MDEWLRGLPEAPPPPPSAGSTATRTAIVPDRPADVSFLESGELTARRPAAARRRPHRYNIDLTPQLLLCAGEMVDALRSSGVASYPEFKPAQAHLYGSSPELQRVLAPRPTSSSRPRSRSPTSAT